MALPRLVVHGAPNTGSSAARKVLALYDIHGNVDALDAVLSDPRAAAPDAVLIGGDALPGPFATATHARLDALDVPVYWIRGNGEREVGESRTFGAPDPADLVRVTECSLRVGRTADPSTAR